MKTTLCRECGQKPASFFYSETINGKKKEICLCHECAQKRGFEKEMNPFSSLFFSAPLFPEAEKEACPLCGMSLLEIQKSGKFGCSGCFDAFAEKLDLSPFVGKGCAEMKKAPKVAPEKEKSEVEKLKELLSEAVEREEYEKAAALRDQIRALEAK